MQQKQENTYQKERKGKDAKSRYKPLEMMEWNAIDLNREEDLLRQ